MLRSTRMEGSNDADGGLHSRINHAKACRATCPNGSRAASSPQWIPNHNGSRVARHRPVVSKDIGRITAHVQVEGLSRADLEQVVRLPSAEHVRCNPRL